MTCSASVPLTDHTVYFTPQNLYTRAHWVNSTLVLTIAEYVIQQGPFLPDMGLGCCALFLIFQSQRSSHWYLQQFSQLQVMDRASFLKSSPWQLELSEIILAYVSLFGPCEPQVAQLSLYIHFSNLFSMRKYVHTVNLPCSVFLLRFLHHIIFIHTCSLQSFLLEQITFLPEENWTKVIGHLLQDLPQTDSKDAYQNKLRPDTSSAGLGL